MTRRRAMASVAWLSAGALVVTGAFWAGRAATEVPTIAAPPDVIETVLVQDGVLGRSVEVTVQARWMLADVARASVAGTVTTIPERTSDAAAGTTLLTIDLRPVVLAQGGVPSFRDLVYGAAGQDVVQLQDFLRTSGFSSGASTGTFGEATARSVKAWQKSLGVEQTGTVLQGDLLFVEDLPARLVLDPAVVVGAAVTPGDVLVKSVSESPELWVESDASTSSPLRADIGVVVETGDFSWDALVSRVETDPETGSDRLVLAGPDSTAVCGSQCGEAIPVLPPGESSVLAGRAVITPEVAGAMVPQSALGSTATGQSIVLDGAGRRVPVDVLVVADGQAVVTGVVGGDTVRLHGSDE